MSGSLVLRSGVGTQMLMVSSSRMTLKSLVAVSLAFLTRSATSRRGDVLNVRLARVQRVNLRLLNVDAGDDGTRLLHTRPREAVRHSPARRRQRAPFSS